MRVAKTQRVRLRAGSCAGHGVFRLCADRHLVVDHQYRLRLEDSPKEHFHRPAADPLFQSVANSFGPFVVGVVLTGMGHDGRLGALQIAAAGGVILAEDPATAANSAMPRAVIETGIVSDVRPIDAMGRAVARRATDLVKLLNSRRAAK